MGFKLKKFFSGENVRKKLRPVAAVSTFGISEVDPGAESITRTGSVNSGHIKTGLKRGVREGEAVATVGGSELNRNQGINYGGKNDALFGGAKKYQNSLAVADAKERQAAQEKNEANLLERANAQFGVGLNPEAQANASRMRARRDAAARGAFGAGRQEAEQEYASGLSDTRATLARAGLTGSGVEGQARNDLLARYFGGITQAQQAGAKAGQAVDTGATTSRLALRSGIRGGQITDTTGLGSEIAGLNAQGSNGALWENSVGKFLPVAAQQYGNRRLANAFGSPR